MDGQHTPRERVMWSIGILVVVLYALIPVRVDRVAVAEDRPTSSADKKFFSGGSRSTTTTSIFSDDTLHSPRWSTRSASPRSPR